MMDQTESCSIDAFSRWTRTSDLSAKCLKTSQYDNMAIPNPCTAAVHAASTLVVVIYASTLVRINTPSTMIGHRLTERRLIQEWPSNSETVAGRPYCFRYAGAAHMSRGLGAIFLATSSESPNGAIRNARSSPWPTI